MSQWWSNGPLGFEQELSVAHAPAAGSGPLTFAFDVSGTLHPRLVAGSVEFVDAAGRVVLRYGDLSATDARGRTLPSSISVRGNRLVLHVDAAGAQYPITVDPLVQLAELTASDGVASDSFGQSGGVAAAGSTIAVGANGATVGSNATAGAVYVFTEPPSGWANATETAKLTASDPVAGDALGSAVAITSDGTTIAAGAPDASVGTTAAGSSAGKVYVFTKPSGGWASATQTAELTEAKLSQFAVMGSSLAFSGTTLFAGAPTAGSFAGEVDIFNKPSGGWVNGVSNGTLTTNVGGLTGIGNAVAASGNLVAVGGALGGLGVGSAYLYVEPSGGWASSATQTETATLTPNDLGSSDALGTSVAVSGTTVVVGAPAHNTNGAAYVFTQPSGGWSGTPAQTAELTASDGASTDALGTSVATNGSTVYAGAPGATIGANTGQGAVYEFDEPAAGWANETQTAKITATTGGGDAFGASLAVNGTTLLVGANTATIGANLSQGAAYMYVAPPTVTAVSPAKGTTAGGTSVTITGTGFASGDTVNFGSTAATGVTVNSATSITAVAPAGAPAPSM